MGVFGNDAGDLVNGENFSGSSFANRIGYGDVSDAVKCKCFLLLTISTEYGTFPMAGGSGAARLSYLVPPLDAIKAHASQDGTLVQYILNNTMLSGPAKVRNRADELGFILPVPDVCLVFPKTWASGRVD